MFRTALLFIPKSYVLFVRCVIDDAQLPITIFDQILSELFDSNTKFRSVFRHAEYLNRNIKAYHQHPDNVKPGKGGKYVGNCVMWRSGKFKWSKWTWDHWGHQPSFCACHSTFRIEVKNMLIAIKPNKLCNNDSCIKSERKSLHSTIFARKSTFRTHLLVMFGWIIVKTKTLKTFEATTKNIT